MGLLDRFRRSAPPLEAAAPAPLPPPAIVPQVTITMTSSVPNPQRAVVADRPATLPWGSTVEVVGESYYQDSFLSICGPKCSDGHDVECVAELRPEPDNQYDPAAIGIYVTGLKVGHLSREDARSYRAVVLDAIDEHGVASCSGLIRGGWDRGHGDEGHFGIQLRFSDRRWALVDPDDDEIRLPPGGSVSVSNEERYQDTLLDATKGRDVTARSYPVLAELVLAQTNPWTKSDASPILEVRLDGQTAGFLTPAMTNRFRPIVEAAVAEGKRVTTEASLYTGTKGGEDIVEIRLHAERPRDPNEPITITPKRLLNIRTGTNHFLGEQLDDGSWRAACGTIVSAGDVQILGYTKPWIGMVDCATQEVIEQRYTNCSKC